MTGAFVYSSIVNSPPASYSHSDRRTDRGTRRNNLVLILHRRYLLRPTPRRIRIRTPTTLTAIHAHVHVHELNTSHPPRPDGHRHQLTAVPLSYIRAQMQDEPAGEHGRDGLQHERHRRRDEQSAVGRITKRKNSAAQNLMIWHKTLVVSTVSKRRTSRDQRK